MPACAMVTGATGFVGRAVVDELLRRGCSVHALARPGQQVPPPCERLHWFRGDLLDEASLAAAVEVCDAVIHLVGIIAEAPSKGVTFERIHVEGTRNILRAANRGGTRRYVHMSALGSRPTAVSDYHKTKWRAEELVRTAGLDWTIFRPSMIHGPHGEFMQMAAKWARKQAMPYLFMPYFGKGLLGFGGSGLIQPVFVDDVARAFVDSLEKPETLGREYELVGPDQLTWPRMHKMIARAIVGKERLTAPIPAWYAKALAAVAPKRWLPFNRDQVIMSQEDNTADVTPFISDFGWSPVGFEQSLGSYAHSL